jgi:ABC-2 type transport system ATP-binding protein
VLDTVNLTEHAKTKAYKLSKGMRQRLIIARAILHSPKLLFLDEPTSGLDPVSTNEVKTLVKTLAKGGMTVLMTSHLLGDAQDVCDRIAILNRGEKVAEGKVSELGGSLESYFLAKVGEGRAFAVAPFLK